MKRQLALMAAAAVIASAGAAVLSPEQAIQRARGNSPARARGVNATEMKLVHTASTAKGEAAAYVFAFEDDHGYTILSANDIAVPVLGYSNSGRIDTDNMPPALKWWLGQYAAQIEYAESKGISMEDNSRYRAPEAMAEIAPLVKTKWDQGEPYSNMCPKSGNVVCPTGCVATSMAQAMNYFKYPDQAEGSIQYRWNNRMIMMDFSQSPFEWDKMLDVYTRGDYTEEQADAVAYLMKACGYSVEMDYSAYMSGAVSANIINAMKNYFKYDKNIRYVSRDTYSYDEWVKICYDNLRNCGPIIYNGTDPIAGGHSFIVDGYDGNGYFHLNWGWSGMSDGYFSLDALTPAVQGAGGAMGGFNYSQDAVIGMKKPDGTPEANLPKPMTQYGNTDASLNGRKIEFDTKDWNPSGWCNLNQQALFFYFGAMFENTAGGEPVYVQGTLGNDSKIIRVGSMYIVNPSYGLPTVEIPDLADGTYKVTLVTKNNDDADRWIPVNTTYGYSNYCMLTVSGSNFKIENMESKSLAFEKLEIVSPLYYNRNAKLKATIKNPTDLQLTACVTPKLLKGGVPQFTAETILITVDPGETLDYEWVARFYILDGADRFADPSRYTLTLVNQESGGSYGDFGEVEMTSTSNGYTLRLETLEVAGLQAEPMEIGGTQYPSVYAVPNPTDFTVNLSYKVSKGYFDSTIIAAIYRRANSGSTSYVPVTDNIYESTPFLGTGESETVSIPVKFTENNPEDVYYVRVQYIRNSTPVYLGQIVIHSDVADVSEIVDSVEGGETEYYNLQGMRIANPEPGMLVIRKKGVHSEKVIF